MKCSVCGREYPPDEKVYMCLKKDSGRLDVEYDYSAIAEKVNRKNMGERAPFLWKYFEFLPIKKRQNIVTLNEGGSPLLKAEGLAEKIGLRNLYLKDETRNPTGSFKDRSMTVGVSKAVEFEVKTVTTASSGNAAASLAAYSAKAGLRCFAFVLESASMAKIAQIRLHGTRVVKVKPVEEGKDPTVQMLRKVVEEYGWYPCPSFGPFNPYQVEGPKTISYEIIEQLGWKPPDWIIIPVGSACLLAGVWKGLRDFREIGFTDSMPKLAAIQSTGCAPLVRAFREKKSPREIKPWKNPRTVAGGLADVFPWDADAALDVLRKSGIAEAVPDDEILEAQKLLASVEGVFAEPSGVASLAGLIKLVESGVIGRDETVVTLITGSGLKDPEAPMRGGGEVPVIKPDIEEFKKKILNAGK